MVKNSRAPARPGALRPLNRPESREVRETAGGSPAQVLLRRQWVTVTGMEDRWRIDDEWWRAQPLSRMYYQVVLEDGRRLTLFRDLAASQWYEQRYV